MFGRYDLLARNLAVRTDMNNVRRNLARVNPRGYSAPIRVVVSADESIVADVLPLFFVSSVLREKLGALDERPVRAELRLKGYVPLEVVKIVLAYADGSARAQNWAADLDLQPNLAAYVWDFARAYKIEMLEELVRDAAFDKNTGSLCPDTAPRLLAGSSSLPRAYYDLVHQYFCYQLDFCARAADFPLLSYKDFKSILTSQQLRATQGQRFNAIITWQTGKPPHVDEDRDTKFYGLIPKLHFVLTKDPNVLAYKDWAFDSYLDEGILPPEGPVDQLKWDNTSLCAFDICPMMEMAASRAGSEYPDTPPRFLGQFKAYNYYFQVEIPWYDKEDVEAGPCVGFYLRLLHGSDMAGLKVRGEVVGVQVAYRLRIHFSGNLSKCWVASELFDIDMMNIPGRRAMHGYRHFLTRKQCKQIIKVMKRSGRKPEWRASVEILRVKELPKTGFF